MYCIDKNVVFSYHIELFELYAYFSLVGNFIDYGFL